MWFLPNWKERNLMWDSSLFFFFLSYFNVYKTRKMFYMCVFLPLFFFIILIFIYIKWSDWEKEKEKKKELRRKLKERKGKRERKKKLQDSITFTRLKQRQNFGTQNQNLCSIKMKIKGPPYKNKAEQHKLAKGKHMKFDIQKGKNK